MKCKPKNIDIQPMIDTAVAFFLAAERCAPNLAFGVYKPHSVSAPRIVNYALSIEIILKLFLYVENGKRFEGHDLRKLFSSLRQSSQIEIAGAMPRPRELSDFVDLLGDEKNTFINWRYPYEADFLATSCGDLRQIFIAIHAVLNNIHPHVKSVYAKNWGGFRPDPAWAWHELEMRDLGLAQ
ncbi:MAG: hypothetical protein ACRCTD_13545 [Beijerinckiaceae bacterium]